MWDEKYSNEENMYRNVTSVPEFELMQTRSLKANYRHNCMQ